MQGGRSQQITAGLLTIQVGFQMCLAAGVPWGRASFGGQHAGALPRGYRCVSGVAAIAYAAAVAVLTRTTGSGRSTRGVLTGVSMTMTVGTLANGASRSTLERALWTPYCALVAVCAWRARAQS